jgi:ABC-type spermidine/putrescine transport system permease subunit I
MLSRSLTDPHVGLQNFVAIFTTGADLHVIWTTVRISLVVTVITVLLAYPTAYFLSSHPSRLKLMLTVALTVPYWISILVRTFAWLVILGSGGVIDNALTAVGIKVGRLLYTEGSLIAAMVQILLPLAILILKTTMDQVDRTLVPAARTLGASATQAFIRVYLPLTRRIIVSGALIVFVLSMGFYITPVLLGGPGDIMVGVLIADQVNVTFEWGVAAGLSAILVFASVGLYMVVNRLTRLEGLLGAR